MNSSRTDVPVVPLRELLREPVRNGYSPVCGGSPTGRWVLGLGALSASGLDSSRRKPAPPNDPNVDRTLLEPGDVLISRSNTRDKVGLAAMWRGEVEHCSYPDLIMRVRIDERRVDPDYLECVLRSPAARRHFETSAAGTSGSMVKITKRAVETFQVPLPPLEEQRRIAAILDTWDAAIRNSGRLAVAHERLLGGLQSALILTPRHRGRWEQERLGELATIKKGRQLNITSMVSDGKYRALNGGVSESGRTNAANAPGHTITVSEGGNSCGFVSFIAEDFWCGGHCYALRDPRETVHVRYLYHYLKARQADLMRLRTGSGLPNITKKSIASFIVDVPPRQEQHLIATCLDSAEQAVALRDAIRERYTEQRRSLVEELVLHSGVCGIT